MLTQLMQMGCETIKVKSHQSGMGELRDIRHTVVRKQNHFGNS